MHYFRDQAGSGPTSKGKGYLTLMQHPAALEILFPELESPSRLLWFRPCANLFPGANVSPVQRTDIKEQEVSKVLL